MLGIAFKDVSKQETTFEYINEAWPSQLSTMGSPWRPFWLRPNVIASLGGIFLLFAVLLETLLSVSDNNQGLAITQPELRYM